jgi:hypothetical protein
MHLDCRDYPVGYLLTEVIAQKLGIYVSIADWSVNGDRRTFRMIIDGTLDKRQVRELMFSTIKDTSGTYEFAYLETIMGPVVDQGPRVNSTTSYIRVTFI